jgi:hypothetical protein
LTPITTRNLVENPFLREGGGSGPVYILPEDSGITRRRAHAKHSSKVLVQGHYSMQKNSLHLKPAQHFIVCNSKFTVEIHQNKQGVRHAVASSFTEQSTLRQKKNYGNSNISPCKNIIFKKSSKRKQNPSRYYNSITNLKFQHKPQYHLSRILI